MSRMIQAGEQLRNEIAETLGDLVDTVTLDGAGIKSSTRAAVVIFPPEVNYTTFDAADLVWSFAVVAGPADRPLIAWGVLDMIVTRLEESGLNLATAKPATFGLAGAGTLPAYEITLNPLED